MSSGKSSYSAPFGRAVDVASGSAFFVGAEQQAAALFAHIPRAVGAAQNAHFGLSGLFAGDDFGDVAGQDILMLDRDDGDIQPDHFAGLAREVAGRANDMLASDIAFIGFDNPFVAAPFDGRDGRAGVDNAAQFARPGGERIGEIGGLDIAVLAVNDGA